VPDIYPDRCLKQCDATQAILHRDIFSRIDDRSISSVSFMNYDHADDEGQAYEGDYELSLCKHADDYVLRLRI